MQMYRFFNPSAYGNDKCVIILSATTVEALCAYVDRYHPNCNGYVLSQDINRHNAIIMSISKKILDDGVIFFEKIFTIDIN